MRKTLLALALMLTLVPCAFAGSAPACLSYAKIKAEHWTGPQFRVVELQPAQRAVVTQRYNESEPKTNFHPGHIYIIEKADNPVLKVVLVNGDCILALGDVPAVLVNGWLGEP